MLLIIVRRGATDLYRYLLQTLADQPVYVMWDRRVHERRQESRCLPGDRRRCTDRRATAPGLTLGPLPFIAVGVETRLGAPDRPPS